MSLPSHTGALLLATATGAGVAFTDTVLVLVQPLAVAARLNIVLLLTGAVGEALFETKPDGVDVQE